MLEYEENSTLVSSEDIDLSISSSETFKDSLHKLNLYFLLFIWFSSVVFFGLVSFENEHILESSKFLILGSISISVITFVFIIFAKSISASNTALLCGFIPLVLLPKFIFYPGDNNSVLLVELFYILVLVSPALLNIWGWIPQFLACTVSIISLLYSYDSLQDIDYFRPFFLIAAVSALSTLVLYFRKSKEFYKDERFCSYLVSQLSQSSPHSLKVRFTNTSLAQAGLIIILLLVSGLSASSELQSAESILKIYAIIILVFGNLLVGLLKKSYIVPLIVVCEVLVPFLVILSFKETASYGLLIVFSGLYCFSTIFLGWSFKNQISLCWIVIITSLYFKFFNIHDEKDFLTEFSSKIFLSHKELGLLVFIVLSSVLFFKVIRKASWEKAFEIFKNSQNSLEGSLVTKVKNLEKNVVSLLGESRLSSMMKALALLTFASSFLSTVLVFEESSEFWGLLSLIWVLPIIFWLVLNHYINTENIINFDKLSVAAAVLAIILILFPTILIISGGDVSKIWTFWTILPIIGIGLVHWGMAELIVVSAVCLVCGFEVLVSVNASEFSKYYFLFIGIASVTSSISSGKKSRQNYLSKYIPEYISSAKNIEQLSILFADVMRSYFQDKDSFVILGNEDILLLRKNALYSLDKSIWPIREEILESSFEKNNRKNTGYQILNWLSGLKEFYHKDLGYFSTNHALAFELSLNSYWHLGKETLTMEDGDNSKLKSHIVLPLKAPFFKSISKVELEFINNVLSLFELKLESFLEREAYLSQSRSNDLIQEEREYELSALVHDVNNSVQDLTVLCDSLIEDIEKIEGEKLDNFSTRLSKVSMVAKSMATVVSDAKRKKELDKLKDLTPKELVNVSKVLDDIIEFSIIRAERKRIEIIYDKVDTSLWVKVSAKEHLETIIRNVINNAITYSEPGTNISLKVENDEQDISIEIIDQGPGLGDQDLTKIFTAGYRGKKNIFSTGGLGIGLHQSKRIAESANGSLKAFSKGLGMGSSFLLKLPVHLKKPDSQQERWALIVDDQTSFVEFYVKIFKTLKLKSEISNSCKSAIEILEKKGRPSFVLTDLHLGSAKGSGYELIEYVRHSYGDFVPILVISGLPDEDIGIKIKETGANDFISKPVGRRELYLKLKELLDKLSSE